MVGRATPAPRADAGRSDNVLHRFFMPLDRDHRLVPHAAARARLLVVMQPEGDPRTLAYKLAVAFRPQVWSVARRGPYNLAAADRVDHRLAVLIQRLDPRPAVMDDFAARPELDPIDPFVLG